MKSEWKECVLGDIITFQRGYDLPKTRMTGTGYPVVGSNGVIGYHSEFNVTAPCITIGRSGNVGNPHMTKGAAWAHNTTLFIKEYRNADPCFIFYFLKTLNLDFFAGGSAVPTLNRNHIHSLNVRVPSLPTQRKIAAVLSSLDDKIETNNAICRNLEEQVLAIYDETMERVPVTMKKMEEVFDVFIGKTPPRKQREWFTSPTEGVTWVSIADMGRGAMFMRESSENLTAEAVEKFHVKIVPAGAVMLSFKLTVGRVAIAAKELVTNEAIAHFVASDNVWMEYLYCYLRRFNYESLGNTSSIATAVNSKTIKAMPMLCPAPKEIRRFHAQVAAHFELIKEKLEENTRLAALRDTLLPRLMRGEIDVDKVQL